jgi:transcriptional regulator with XRE-family HTH domain
MPLPVYCFLEITMIDEKIIDELREYVKDHYVPPRVFSSAFAVAASMSGGMAAGTAGLLRKTKAPPFRDESNEVSEYIKEHKTSSDFAHALDRLREEKGFTPIELYKRAGVDRRQYSRFMGPEGRHPSMKTAISFALALKLNREEFDKFLQTAGYALSCSSSRDVCIMFCLEKGIHDVEEVNALLFTLGLDPLARE